MADPNNEKRRPVARWAWIGGVATVWPALAVALVWRRINWRRPWVSLSVLLNILFLSALAIVALDERTLSQIREDSLQALIVPDCVECEPELLKFCRPRVGSELARIEPNTIHVVHGGVRRGRFEFEDENMHAITEMAAFDEFGRSWINVNFQDGQIIFDHYPNDAEWSPDFSLIDRDLDGMPDQKVDWDLAKRFERTSEIVWHPLIKKDD